MTDTDRAAKALGAWMSAALDDPTVCEEMKRDIQAWFAAGMPAPPLGPVARLIRAREAWKAESIAIQAGYDMSPETRIGVRLGDLEALGNLEGETNGR